MTFTILSLWATRTYDPDEPELLTAWDEYSVDANYDGWLADCESAKASMGKDLLDSRVIEIAVDRDEIVAAFGRTAVKGTVVK